VLTENDKNYGPLTIARWPNYLSLVWGTSGDDDGGREFNYLRVIAFGWCAQLKIPAVIKPHKEKVMAKTWDAATVARLGRDWHYNVSERLYGFSISKLGDHFLIVYFGRVTHDSSTDQQWCCHFPWEQWEHVRHSLYRPDGSHYATRSGDEKWESWYEKTEQCPTSQFLFKDYDGTEIVATCCIEEMEWHKGRGWFKWLRWFHQPKIRRSLDLKFSAEVGPAKGSWKGGTIGHGIDMLPGEYDTPQEAFRRYCGKDHRHRGKDYKLQFIGPVIEVPKGCDGPEGEDGPWAEGWEGRCQQSCSTTEDAKNG
jgi:hypothetical protein